MSALESHDARYFGPDLENVRSFSVDRYHLQLTESKEGEHRTREGVRQTDFNLTAYSLLVRASAVLSFPLIGYVRIKQKLRV